jgi:outer membrane protein assembly factor BamB
MVMSKPVFAFVAAVLFSVVVLIGCSGSSGSAGATGPAGPSAPSVIGYSLVGDSALLGEAKSGGTLTATIFAQSAQDKTLTYAWSLDASTISSGWTILTGATTSVATIQAPSAYGSSGFASVVVSDGTYTTVPLRMELRTEGDSAPIIQSMTIYPQPALKDVQLSARAYDPNGDALSYDWFLGGIYVTNGPDAGWHSHGMPGFIMTTLVVSEVSNPTVSTTGSLVMNFGSSAPWPRFRRDLQSSGASPLSSNGTGTLLWSFPTGSMVVASPVIGSDNTVYIGSQTGVFYALTSQLTVSEGVSVASVITKWTVTTGGGISGTAAVATDDGVYVVSTDGDFYKMNTNGTGTLIDGWSLPLSAPSISSASSVVHASDDSMYVGSANGHLYCVNDDSTLKWQYPPSGAPAIGAISSSPTVGVDGTVYVGSEDGTLYAISSSGNLLCAWSTGGPIKSSPLYTPDGTVYVTSGDGKLYGYTLSSACNSGGPFFDTGFAQAMDSSPAMAPDGTVYFGADDGYLYAVDGLNRYKWRYQTQAAIKSSPAIGSDGTVYVGSQDWNVYAINADGSLQWTFLTGGPVNSSPAIGVRDTIYVGSDDGNVYAIH